jgi:hypothetical protein
VQNRACGSRAVAAAEQLRRQSRPAGRQQGRTRWRVTCFGGWMRRPWSLDPAFGPGPHVSVAPASHSHAPPLERTEAKKWCGELPGVARALVASSGAAPCHYSVASFAVKGRARRTASDQLGRKHRRVTSIGLHLTMHLTMPSERTHTDICPVCLRNCDAGARVADLAALGRSARYCILVVCPTVAACHRTKGCLHHRTPPAFPPG